MLRYIPGVLLGFTFGIRLGLDVECGTSLLVTVRGLVEEPISALPKALLKSRQLNVKLLRPVWAWNHGTAGMMLRSELGT